MKKIVVGSRTWEKIGDTQYRQISGTGYGTITVTLTKGGHNECALWSLESIFFSATLLVGTDNATDALGWASRILDVTEIAWQLAI